MKIKLENIYRELNKKVPLIKKPEYSKLVNFSENINEPRHRWFNLKEGFSAKIIRELIKRFDGKEDDLVFDPFSGSGTTILASKELGANSFGFEVNPFLLFVGRTKLISKPIKLDKYIEKIKKLKIKKGLKPPKLSISKKLFPKQLNEVLTIKEHINSLKKSKEKDLLKLAFLCSLEKCSTSKKDGNGLKYPKNKIPSKIKIAFIEKIEEIKKDIEKMPLSKRSSKIYGKDARNIKNRRWILNKYSGKVKFCLFSPPYMNCFDYTEVYKMELWFGDFIKDYSELKKLRGDSFDSHLNKTLKNKKANNSYVDIFVKKISKEKLWNKKIPNMIFGYFKDMESTLKNIYELLEDKGVVVCVVGNSAYGNIAIPTDSIIGDIALNIGFKKSHIEVARKLGTSSQQYKKVNDVNSLRESLVILEK